MTEFGKFLRKLRIDNNELLKNMAEHLNVTPSYLSAIEIGKRNIPKDWFRKIVKIYNLNANEQIMLQGSIDRSKNTLKIPLNEMSDNDRDLTISFARKLENLTKQEKEQLLSILKHKDNR